MRILWEEGETSGATGGTETPASTAAPSAPSGDAESPPAFAGIEDEGPPDENIAATEEAAAAPETAETNAEKTETPAPAAPALPLALMERAFKLGMDAAEISEFPSAKELELTLKAIERRAPKPEAKKEDSAAQPGDEVKIDEIPDLDPNEYEKPLVEGWSKLKGLVKTLHTELQAVRAESVQRAQAEAVEWFEGQITALGAEGEGLFGKGHGRELKADGTELANREKLWGALQTLRAGYANRREKPPAQTELFKQAYRLAFGDSIAQNARKQVAQHLTTRKKTFLAPPTQRTSGNSIPPEQKAVLSVSEKLQAIKAR
ncbi:MAG TPA: hypothetical protein VEJ63_19775 [Planctomycetota bacterium]|nr:hypothetical protein [Planctomycetota bacterium]